MPARPNAVESFGFSRINFLELLERLTKGRLKGVSVDPGAFRLSHLGGSVYLEGYYRHFIFASPQDHDAVLRSIVDEICEPANPPTYGTAKPHLLVAVDSEAGLSLRQLALQTSETEAGEWVRFEIVPNFMAYLVLDRKLSRQFIASIDLERWTASRQTAYSDALANLKLRTARGRYAEVERGVLQSEWEDGYDASRMLLGPSGLDLPFSNPVVMPLTSNCLLSADRDPDSILKLSEIALEIGSEDPSLILFPRMMTWDSHGWKLLDVDGPSTPIQELQCIWLGRLYDDQQAILRKKYTDPDEDPYISSYSLVRGPDGLRSYSTWTEGIDVPLWLPRTDLIVMVADDGTAEPFEWELIEKTVGTPERITGFGLDRYAFVGFPDPALRQAMKRDSE